MKVPFIEQTLSNNYSNCLYVTQSQNNRILKHFLWQ